MDFDPVLLPLYEVQPTKRFTVVCLSRTAVAAVEEVVEPRPVFVDLNCAYTRRIVESAVQRRPWCRLLRELDTEGKHSPPLLQFCDFENISWEFVLSGRHGAASYLVRKGLSRKAQLSLQIRRHLSKNPTSLLKTSVPHTIILETWNAFDEMKLDFGGGTFASFDLGPSSSSGTMPLRQRLEWCLEDVRSEVCDAPERADWLWILKPSVTNKGVNISVCSDWDGIMDCVESAPEVREWVLQKYVHNPLLLDGRKFHLRVYVLCVGSLKVHVFDRILLLLAAHRYSTSDLDDIYKHLTNTAVASETEYFDEEQAVKLLDDLPHFVSGTGEQDVRNIRTQIHQITAELFRAFENEYTVFAPMPQCFELFGLDFLVDEHLQVHLLEANPGPDFKQTGLRLRRVIVELWEQTCALVLDTAVLGEASVRSPDFSKVYDKEWSTAKLRGGGLGFVEE